LDLNAVAPKPHAWMTDVTWLNLVELSNLPRFDKIQTQVTKNDRFWKAWFDKVSPLQQISPVARLAVFVGRTAFRTLSDSG